MHRDKLLGLLARYRERHAAAESSICARFLRFAERQPRCFERDCFEDGHVTGSAVLLDADGAAMLMTHHRKLRRWLQPGGHADGETDPLAIACREAAEESGLAVAPLCAQPLDIDIHEIPPHGAEPAHRHYDMRFLLQATDAAPLRVSEESLALRWVPLADLRSVTTEESVLRLAEKSRRWLQRQDGS